MCIEVIMCYISVVFWDIVYNALGSMHIVIVAQFLPRFARNLTTIFIGHRGVPKRIETSQFWFQQSNRQSFLYILYKFGEIWFSDPGVYDIRSYTVGVENFSGVTSGTFRSGWSC